MTELELRVLARDAIARHMGGVSTTLPHPRTLAPSHVMFVLPSGADEDGPCMIEPAVMCNHCGYCKSYGH